VDKSLREFEGGCKRATAAALCALENPKKLRAKTR